MFHYTQSPSCTSAFLSLIVYLVLETLLSRVSVHCLQVVCWCRFKWDVDHTCRLKRIRALIWLFWLCRSVDADNTLAPRPNVLKALGVSRKVHCRNKQRKGKRFSKQIFYFLDLARRAPCGQTLVNPKSIGNCLISAQPCSWNMHSTSNKSISMRKMRQLNEAKSAVTF